MKCPKCKGKTFVTSTIEKSNFVARYRKCTSCTKTFRTKELMDSYWNYKEVLKEIKYIIDKVDV
jgi:transcriptional regulator NrdR family protein